MLVLMLMSMLMSHASVDFFVLSFVLPCAYAYVASENQALPQSINIQRSIFNIKLRKVFFLLAAMFLASNCTCAVYFT